ncbi:MAG: response regulator [Elusimicrobia bacterium]|nr:response regulator [Elusimicrobiota bacterium]
MDPRHSLLRRQLRKNFGAGGPPAELEEFLDAVDAAYRLFDEDRGRLERSLDLSSQELLGRNAEMRALLAAFPDVFLRLDRDGTIREVSAGRPDELNRPARELLGKRVQDGLPGPLGRALELAIVRAADGGEVVSIEYPLTLSSGKKYWEARIVGCGGGQLLMIARDISERVRAQEALRVSEDRLRQSQKMEEIGRLAGGVAHDFNNLLSVILGLSEIVLQSMPKDDPNAEDVAEILETGRRAANLTQQLLTYSRRQIIEPKVVRFNDIVLNVAKLLRRVIGEDIELSCRVGPAVGQVRVDPGQMEQLIVNLAVNARDAMPDGGTLIVATANFAVDGAFALAHPGVSVGDYVKLSVSDAGSGMDAHVLAHVFEPFFTTKAQGKGNGLGLATCYGIVRQNGGRIDVSSEPGRGTTFDILLPRVDDDVSISIEAPSAGPRARGTEKILLVEDDEAVRRMTARVLRAHGYRIVEARDGEEGLSVFGAEACGEPNLVITDMIMPKLGGKRMADEILRDRPDARILFVTGYTDDAALRQGELGRSVLRKPYAIEALLHKVREMLDG